MQFFGKKMLSRIAFIWCLAAVVWVVEARSFHRLNKAMGAVKRVASHHKVKPYDQKKDHEKKHVGATNRLSTILQKLDNKQTSIGKGASVLGDVLKTVGKGIDGLGKKLPAVLNASLKSDSKSMLKRLKSKNVSKSYKKKINLVFKHNGK